jgi:hypothetical protein
LRVGAFAAGASALGTFATCRPDRSGNVYDWFIHHIYMLYGAQAIGAQWAATFKDFPPIQKPNTFTLDDALRMMHETAAGMH